MLSGAKLWLIWKVLSGFGIHSLTFVMWLFMSLISCMFMTLNYDQVSPSLSCEYAEEIALWQGLPWAVLEHIWGRMGVKRADGFGTVFILVCDVLDAFALRTLVARHFCLAKRQKDLPLEPSSAVSWIAFVSRRFWGTQKEALYFFFKVAQKASMSGELWRANILFFEMSIIIFDILTLKKDTEPCFWAQTCRAKGSALVSEGLVSHTWTWRKNASRWEPSDCYSLLPHPTHPGVVTGCWKAGWWRSLSSSREMKRRDSWAHTSSTWPPSSEVLERRLNSDTCQKNQKSWRKACLDINVAPSCKKRL